MASPKNATGDKPKRVVRPMGPRPVFVLIDTNATGLSTDAVKQSLMGFKLTADEALDAIEGKANMSFVRLMVPRTGKPRKRNGDAPAAA